MNVDEAWNTILKTPAFASYRKLPAELTSGKADFSEFVTRSMERLQVERAAVDAKLAEAGRREAAAAERERSQDQREAEYLSLTASLRTLLGVKGAA